jgi:hypothetical protein
MPEHWVGKFALELLFLRYSREALLANCTITPGHHKHFPRADLEGLHGSYGSSSKVPVSHGLGAPSSEQESLLIAALLH